MSTSLQRWRGVPGMMSAPGFVAALRIIPVGDKVALGEAASRVLSASLNPRKVFGGGEARRKLARRAFPRTYVSRRLLLVLSEQLGRYVRQGLVVLYWWPFLPKTGKIAT